MSRDKIPYLVRPPTAVLTRGFDPWLSVGSARPAVFRSSTYVFSSPEAAERAFAIALGRAKPAEGENVDLIYSRLSHPNAEILENQLVPLEKGAEHAAVFNSGMAAISTLFLLLCPVGSAFVYTTPIYGGTHHLIHHFLEPLGIRAVPVMAGDMAAMANAIRETPDLRLVFIETPANPTLRMTDIEHAVQSVAIQSGTRPIVAVDNTFLGPTFQQPLALGADLSVYSATKYLAGQSDMLAGVVMGADSNMIAALRGLRAILGNILQPDECWILDSRLPTVELRMNRQSKNAARIVPQLAHHPKVAAVHYPANFSDPEQRRIRDQQCRYPGAVFSLELHGGKAAAFDFLRRVRIARNAVSLGGVESLVCHPCTTTHSEMSPEELARYGISEGLVRFSIGVEDHRDLLRDFQDALDGQ
ncbi:MAG TPA: PLP-dependent transferase [Polyangiaceae bacterium]|nr:PLP-dependent transferase [Polyangiaceae bacterium]